MQALFLGSVGAASNKAALKNLNITHVLTVAGKLAPSHPRDFVYKIIDGMIVFIEFISCWFSVASLAMIN